MTSRTVSITLAVVCVVLAGPVAGQDRYHYGSRWKEMAQPARNLYLGGVQEGRLELTDLGWLLSDAGRPVDATEADLLRKLALTPQQRAHLQSLLDKRWREVEIEAYGTEVIGNVMANLYEDPANVFIPWHHMARVAVFRLRGGSESEVRGRLEALRRTMARSPDI